MSKELEMEESKRKDMISKAFTMISQKLQDNWNNYAVHKWYAILLDAKSANDGIKTRIEQLENIKKHMDVSIIFTYLYLLI